MSRLQGIIWAGACAAMVLVDGCAGSSGAPNTGTDTDDGQSCASWASACIDGVYYVNSCPDGDSKAVGRCDPETGAPIATDDATATATGIATDAVTDEASDTATGTASAE